ncbi:MAG: response regulator transcription factor [Deltaproteobacteria bacterium]|nr:response regulator transcription factor [Myxococcales bacterium]MDP3214366.1 response regulator transcription factor [Deltaproteobacteria bacterium]
MIRVVLADDHAIVLGGLQRLLAETGDIEVVGTVADGRQALKLCLGGGLAWDVLVLDLSLPRVGGQEVLRRVREALPEARVLVLSMYPEDQYAQQIKRDGAAAYVSKASPPETLVDAIRAVMANGTWVSPGAPKDDAKTAGEALPHRSLSSRELQVFNLVFEGQTVTDIAAQLDLHASTVSNHLRAIKTKLNVNTVAEIVRYAHRVGLID